jgi:hypothetical protein
MSVNVENSYLYIFFYSNDCMCMASFLTPAYLRIAGPSTAHMTFRNTSISIDNLDTQNYEEFNLFQQTPRIDITDRQWMQFVRWAKRTGFDIVFALNNQEKTASGLWDTDTTLSFLSMAENAKIRNIFWQLGYGKHRRSREFILICDSGG